MAATKVSVIGASGRMGSEVCRAVESADGLELVGRFDVASRVRPGQDVEIVVDTRRAHFFDIDSGAAIGGHPVVAEV